MKKTFQLLAFVAICSAIMISCSKEDKQKVNVSLLLEAGSTIERWKYDKEYLREAFSQYNHVHTALHEADDAETQVEQLKTALESGVKNIVITPINYDAINSSGLLEQYPNVNIICHSRLIFNSSRIDFYSSCDIEEIGRLQADYLVQQYMASGKETMTLEMFAGPSGDNTSTGIFAGAFQTLKPLIDKGYLIIKSGKKEYQQVALPEWSRTAASNEMKNRLANYYTDELPDLILIPNDECAIGVINAIDEQKLIIKKYPAITGQDNSEEGQQYLKEGKLGMTVDLSVKEMCYNTAMVVSSMCQDITPATPNSVNNGAIDVPLIKCNIKAVYATKANQ